MLYAPAFAEKAKTIEDLCAEGYGALDHTIILIEIQTAFPEGLSSLPYEVDDTARPSTDQTGSLFFNFGTSGVQKGVVHKYQALACIRAGTNRDLGVWTENDVVLNQKPANWMGGIFGILPSLITGACL